MNAEPSIRTKKTGPPDAFVSPLCFLLRRYARTPSPLIAGRIADCVDRLLTDPKCGVSAQERCTYCQMRAYWRLLENLG